MQDNIQPELIEKYQILLEKDPKSQVFAPLTEAYRKMGLVEEAFRIAVRGVQFNPNFCGGRIALAKVFLDRDNLTAAIDELEKGVELSPDNILAHQLLADCYLKAKRPKDALRSFKMVLYLAPSNEKAIRAVKKLESLTADEYDEDLFQMRPLSEMDAPSSPLKPLETPERLSGDMERTLSLVDAFIVRNDMEKARTTLVEAEPAFGGHPEFAKRLNMVRDRGGAISKTAADLSQPPPNRDAATLERKIRLLRELLTRIQTRSQFT